MAKVQKNPSSDKGNKKSDKPKNSSSKSKTSGSTSESTRAWSNVSPQLSSWMLEAMASMGFEKMTPVQASAIPLFLGNKDVVVEAVTGSGKTLAFLIPVIERILKMDEAVKKHHVASVIVCPTRELATQIHSVLQSVLSFHAPSAKVMNLAKPQPIVEEESDEEAEDAREAEITEHLYGSQVPKVIPQVVLGGVSTPAGDLREFLKWSPNVLVGTPGRLLSLLQSMHVHTPQSTFDTLVLDEADRLLDLGFKDELQGILQALPKQRRTGLFSASVTDAVGDLVRAGLRNPVKIAVKVKSASGKEEKRTPASLDLTYALVPQEERVAAVAKMLVDEKAQKYIVYVSTCAAVDYLSHVLPLVLSEFTRSNASADSKEFKIIPLHGKLTTGARMKNFNAFRAPTTTSPVVLLTTDVAARGLDVPEVDLVIQMDPPTDASSFMHRAGRAGRAGRHGKAVLFLSPGREEDYVAFLAIRGTPAVKQEYTSISQDILIRSRTRMRQAQLNDRAVLDKGQRGFVSWVRSYAKHDASSIFRLADIDWAAHLRAWGLLRMPDMPEARSWLSQVIKEAEGDQAQAEKPATKVHPNEHPAVLKLLGLPDPGLKAPASVKSSSNTLGIDLKSVPYAHPQREAKRQRLLEEPKPSKSKAKPHGNEDGENAWSRKTDLKNLRETRREARSIRREKTREAGLSAEEKAKKDELRRMIEQVRQSVAAGSNEGSTAVSAGAKRKAE